MKTLVVITHPNIEESKVNKTWKEHLKTNNNITIHELYKNYSNGKFDISKEQDLLINHDRIVFQFPFYWYNAPSLLKEWLDTVFAFGFSHGPEGNKLAGKELMLVISAGGKKEAYQAGGAQLYSISELTKQYQALANFTKMIYLPPFILHETHKLTESNIIESAIELKNILN